MKATRIGRGRQVGLALVLGLGLAAGVGGVMQVRAVSPSQQDLCLQGDVANPNSGQTGAPAAACSAGQFDWTDFFNSSGGSKTLPTGTFGTFTDSNFQADAALPDKTTFATGSKDTLQISGGSSNWQCGSSNNLGAKVDLANTYATIERLSGVNGHTILYYGSEIQSANGDHNQGMWLLQDPNVGCTAGTGNTPFNGSHVNGDLLFAVQLTGGGTKPFSASTVGFKWTCTNDPITKVCPTSSPGSLIALNGGASLGGICSPTSTTDACAITDKTWNVVTPWAPHSSGTTALGPQQFFEGGIDITAVETSIGGSNFCSSRFLTDTRSSQSPTATLFDYTQGSLNTCAAPTLTTTIKPSSTVVVGNTVHDTATLTGAIGTAGGSITYDLYTSCTNVNGQGVGSGVPSASATTPSVGTTGDPNFVSSGSLVSGVPPDSATLTMNVAGSYAFVASYSGDGINLATKSPCEPLTISKASPSLATTAGSTGTSTSCTGSTPSGTVGQPVNVCDAATLSNFSEPASTAPSGNVTFSLLSSTTGTGGVVCGSAVTLSNLSTTVTSTFNVSGVAFTGTTLTFTPTSVGTYYWTASWGGDTQNNAPNSGNAVGCGDANEAVTVNPATPTLKTSMGLTDTVTVSGGDNPTGTVTFSLWIGSDCGGTQVGSSETVSLVGGTATTPTAISIPTAATVYSWKVQYNPDNTNNISVTDGCTPATSLEQVTTSYVGQ